MSELKNYIEGLLENVADELHVKEVRLLVPASDTSAKEIVYGFDTIKKQGIGIKKGWPYWSLVFSGDILEDMEIVRGCVAEGLKQRAEAGIKVRQPLQSITITVPKDKLSQAKINSLVYAESERRHG